MDQKTIRFLKNLSTGLVVVAVIFAFLIAGIRIFGVQVYGVLTGSMEPTYPTGSLIYVKPVDTGSLRVNDVITFSISPNVIATHRIVEIVPDETNPAVVRYRTKGDANRDVDASLVSANNIIGKAMFGIPQMGYLASYIQQPPGIYVALLVCGLMIAFVFYTDSLDSKQSNQNGQQTKPRLDFAGWINQLSQKLLGKPLLTNKTSAEPAFQQEHIPQQRPQAQAPMQQKVYPQQYPAQQYAYPQQNLPRQGYPQQYPMQPHNYPQQYPPQGYPMQQPAYPQQPYFLQQRQQMPLQQAQARYTQQHPQQAYPQTPYQQAPTAQQPFSTPQNDRRDVRQQETFVPSQQSAYPQPQRRRSQRM